MTGSGIFGSKSSYDYVNFTRLFVCTTFRWLLCVCVGAGSAGKLCAQVGQPPISTTPNSMTVGGVLGSADSLATPYSKMVADSALAQRDSVFFTGLKQRMYKRRLTRQLYDAIFRDVYNSRRATGEVRSITVNPYDKYRGWIIGAIHVRRLDVFGTSVYDTTRRSGNWIERTGNKLHANTREWVILNYLRFRVGDEVDPLVIQDNERLLRTVNIFLDARILVVPRAGSRQFVEVHVITQDVWSLLPNGGVGSLNQFSVGFEQRNVRGLGHQFYNQFWYNGQDPRQKAEYQARYVVPFIGRTFLTAQADFIYLRDQKQLGVRLFRQFITPDTKWAGSAAVSLNRVNTRGILLDDPDSLLLVGTTYRYEDFWIGRSFKAFFGNRGAQEVHRARIVVALRRTGFTYLSRPEVTADTNQLYQNTRATLLSLGYSRRRYVRDVLIYGFGRTEDVPVGILLAGTGGIDNAELGQRAYLGINASGGRYYKGLGYLYVLGSIGAYTRTMGFEQGVIGLQLNYFSPLIESPRGSVRHFVNLRYTSGFDRFNNEFLDLSSRDLFGVNNLQVVGTKRLFTGYEGVLFSRVSLLGFRVAFVGFANFALINFPGRSLAEGPLYQNYGIALRLRNENLTFNSIQIRLSWFPNLPNNASPFRFGFDGIPTLRFRDFDITAPQIVPYQ